MTKSFFTLVLLVLVLLSCDKEDNLIDSNPNTASEIKKGVFGLRNASLLSNLGAEYTRIIAWDTDIKSIYEEVNNGVPLENNMYYNQVKTIHDNGIKIILTLRWPDQSSSDPTLYDRVPVSNDKIESLDLLSRFLNDFGPLLDIYSVQNEVGGLGPGTYSQSDMVNNGNGSNAVLWWKDIVGQINTEKENNPNLSNLKISSPVPILLKRLVFDNSGLPQTNIDFFYETISFGNEYCDYIDFHFNTFTLGEYPTTLNFLNSLINKPMIATEWSEVGSASDYISQPISNQVLSYASSINYNIPSNLITNDELIEHLYNNPITIEFWQLVVEESNYQENFMEQSSSMLSDAGFEIICWNKGWQEGITAFDLRSFYATKTVGTVNNEISTLIDEFINF